MKNKKELEGMLTINNIAKAMHVDYYYVLEQILCGNLKAMPIMGKKKTSYRVEQKDYEEWKEHLKKIMQRNIRLASSPEPQCGLAWAKKIIGVQ